MASYHSYNESDFIRYTQEIDKFINRLGITEWKYSTVHKQLDTGISASVNYDVKAKNALFSLTKIVEYDYGLETDVVALSKHEVFHLLFADLCQIAADEQSSFANPVIACEHGVINRLMRVI